MDPRRDDSDCECAPSKMRRTCPGLDDDEGCPLSAAAADLPSVHAGRAVSEPQPCPQRAYTDTAVAAEPADPSSCSPCPGPSGLALGLPDCPSPPYASLFPGLSSSLPSASQSQTIASPLLDPPMLGGGSLRCSGRLGNSTDLSDDQLAGNHMPIGMSGSTASGTLGGFPCPTAYSPLPLYGDASDTHSLQLPAYESKSNLSDSASAILAICRICHQPADEIDILISPCRCAGTLQFIHNTCLLKWLEITSKKSRKPPKCELCHYQYHRHKKFKLDHWLFPRVSRQDKILHIIFIVNLILMIGCAIATVMCFLSDKGQITKFPRNKATLTTEEIITLSCGVLFFVSFFIAMSVQIKAKRTLYQLFVKFIMQNMEWEIDEYDKSKDSLYTNKDLLKSPMYV